MIIKDSNDYIFFSQRLRKGSSIELEPGESFQLFCPASFDKTAFVDRVPINIEVNDDGKLIIEEGSSIIAEIVGKGMKGKVRDGYKAEIRPN